jgi:class I fructose-bisphosphate aldolase
MTKIAELLGDKAEFLLNHNCKTISKDLIMLPGGDFVNRSFLNGNRNPQVLRSLEDLYSHGRLGGTGYV